MGSTSSRDMIRNCPHEAQGEVCPPLRMSLPRNSHLFTNAEAVREILLDRNETLEGGIKPNRIGLLTGDGLFSLNGDIHSEHRKRIQRVFHRGFLPDYAEIMADAAMSKVFAWREGHVIDAYQEMRQLARVVILRAVLGSPATNGIELAYSALSESLVLFDRCTRL